MATSSVTVLGQGIPRAGMRLIKFVNAKVSKLVKDEGDDEEEEGDGSGGENGNENETDIADAALERAATVGIDEIEVDTYVVVQRFLEDLQRQGGKSATTLSAYAHGASISSTPPLDIPLPHSIKTIRSTPESIASDVVDPTQPPDILPSDCYLALPRMARGRPKRTKPPAPEWPGGWKSQTQKQGSLKGKSVQLHLALEMDINDELQ
ncbi:hypothetical protein RND71_008352 [Anisodus tanguticus]|uniref:Uncharacterized protein n=1 Tax=Anisodus tanguticus TaxID=243964 RepID=A0AAE1VJW6_9SOLA|nr:hypothetical protein RND71_008352 [Anisodus tanguticus]